MPTLTVVIASTRPGRVGLPIGTWFADHAKAHGAFEVDVADLAVVDLPFLADSLHPRLGRYDHQHTKDWSARVAASDAFAFVTPEYNHGYPATLKNAMDHLFAEWNHKPLGFVSYGGTSAGTRAVQQLKQVAGALSLVPVVESVNLSLPAVPIEDGRVLPTPAMEEAATAMLDALARTEAALRPLRD